MSEDQGPFAPKETWDVDLAEALVGNDWEENWKRPRGILTDADRRYLWGLTEYASRQTESNRRGDIRGRVLNALLDLSYLSMLEDRDRDMILDELQEEHRGEIYSSIGTLIEFLYLGHDRDLQEIEEFVAHGIHSAEGGRGSPYEGGLKEVNVEIELDWDWDAQEILERYRSGEGYQLTPAEIGILVREGHLDEEDLWQLSRGEGGVPPLDFDEYQNPAIFPDARWHSEDE
jgi:hypothetical protein